MNFNNDKIILTLLETNLFYFQILMIKYYLYKNIF